MSRNCKGQTAQKSPTWDQGCSGEKVLFLSFEEINGLKKQLKPAKAENSKKRKAESLLSTEIILTHSDENEEYFLFPLHSVELGLIQWKILTQLLN